LSRLDAHITPHILPGFLGLDLDLPF
jgi:hypothetical protein